MAEKLCTPSEAQISASILARFMCFVAQDTGEEFDPLAAEAYTKFHCWSVRENETFWRLFWEFSGLIGERGARVIQEIAGVPWARFFADSRLSYAENILVPLMKSPDHPAIIARAQDGVDRVITGQNLYDEVSRWEQALATQGLAEGDHIGIYLPQIPETIMIFLAASNLGLVFSSAGMEMGGDDLINRFNQVRPKILIAGDGYIHGEKKMRRADVITRAQNEISSVQKTIIFPSLGDKAPDLSGLEHVQSASDFLSGIAPKKINFIRRNFNYPLYILFSSGSTGAPKCFEHSSGGVLIKHMCEHQLHCDIKPHDRLFYHSTPSWMMWNWMISALASQATILMYDGNPFYPDAYAQLAFTAENKCTHHGTAAPIILHWAAQNLRPSDRLDLGHLRVMIYTGAVLPEQGFKYIHEHIKSDIKIAPISGGTDLVGSLMGGNPLMPTYAGQINAPLLGLDIQIWDEDGQEVAAGEMGEQVCVNAFPSMPLRFVGDEGGARYEGEYFTHYPDRKAWRHGDSVLKTHEGQYVVIGRSDATLNQNGVRIGASAIYKQLEAFSDQIRDAAAVDFIRPKDKQTLTVLFLVLKEGAREQGADEVPEALQKAIKKAVKDNITPYAIPTEILAVPDILTTPNGKKAEVVIKKILNGACIPNPSLYGATLVQTYEGIAQKLQKKYETE